MHGAMANDAWCDGKRSMVHRREDHAPPPLRPWSSCAFHQWNAAIAVATIAQRTYHRPHRRQDAL